ncbi:Rpn family recombination-promoting nuclease/putative transposase [Mediterraneibacter faecis]|uniref:Rpn family recombination-promoting nuclease/putative transposase n=1 Tax=Mediterraneibacter faecis TaxID=592978 RepID=UPI001D01BB17|nr:Rpn family recombination-promoting nuclease/putative transposase [Mediterraneibacter faecis]MCB5569842.1 Rpn family recombination-promoting nuclease/putative transposase [Mediterraneibacter faecis]MCB5572763.1 Rpn family recombination-promoting nuclease/putative transposase [Mediterraneibacter faecis]MCB5739395.1 Rpn family recombination-promoting nuclease/putative transposase [Mediterraneibacter faecis]MCB5750445.1 Rpn family recombination-promoting nuclease/putative transposase [Mediterran
MTKDKRTLKDLNLMDKFLFDEAMEDKDNMKTLLDIVLGQDTHLKYPPQTEKEFRNSKENRQIRLDVYAIDEDDVVYDTEPQKQNTKNLPKRSRLYQGLIDSNLLPPGSIDFNALNTVIIIMIMPFDLFGYELYQYTFRIKCEEISELELEDGATRIFLNSHGKHPEFVNPELIELLEYMEKSTDTVAKKCESKRIHQMHERITKLKSSKEMEIKYMQKWEEKEIERQEAYAEGERVGEKRGRTEGETRINKLTKYLLEQERTEDLKKAVSDAAYQAKLLKELGL